MVMQVTGALARGTDVALRLDVQGAATLRKLYPKAILLFLVRAAWPGAPQCSFLELTLLVHSCKQ